MNKEKWESIVGNVKDSFEVEEEGCEHIEDEGGIDVNFIVFKGPLGRIRLENIIKPVVLDKKTTYSKRIGSETKIEYIYSPDEKSYNLIAYKWDDNSSEWIEIDGSSFS